MAAAGCKIMHLRGDRYRLWHPATDGDTGGCVVTLGLTPSCTCEDAVKWDMECDHMLGALELLYIARVEKPTIRVCGSVMVQAPPAPVPAPILVAEIEAEAAPAIKPAAAAGRIWMGTCIPAMMVPAGTLRTEGSRLSQGIADVDFYKVSRANAGEVDGHMFVARQGYDYAAVGFEIDGAYYRYDGMSPMDAVHAYNGGERPEHGDGALTEVDTEADPEPVERRIDGFTEEYCEDADAFDWRVDNWGDPICHSGGEI
jgi:hypothetical protein